MLQFYVPLNLTTTLTVTVFNAILQNTKRSTLLNDHSFVRSAGRHSKRARFNVSTLQTYTKTPALFFVIFAISALTQTTRCGDTWNSIRNFYNIIILYKDYKIILRNKIFYRSIANTDECQSAKLVTLVLPVVGQHITEETVITTEEVWRYVRDHDIIYWRKSSKAKSRNFGI